MKQVLWRNGRLSWPPVIAVAYFSLLLVSVDFAWRVLVMPFETLLILTMLVAGALAFLLIAAWVALRRRRIALDDG